MLANVQTTTTLTTQQTVAKSEEKWGQQKKKKKTEMLMAAPRPPSLNIEKLPEFFDPQLSGEKKRNYRISFGMEAAMVHGSGVQNLPH